MYLSQYLILGIGFGTPPKNKKITSECPQWCFKFFLAHTLVNLSVIVLVQENFIALSLFKSVRGPAMGEKLPLFRYWL